MAKLTKAQRAALQWLSKKPNEHRYWVSHLFDPPLNVLHALVDDGMACHKRAAGWFDQFRITDAGRQALSEGEKP